MPAERRKSILTSTDSLILLHRRSTKYSTQNIPTISQQQELQQEQQPQLQQQQAFLQPKQQQQQSLLQPKQQQQALLQPKQQQQPLLQPKQQQQPLLQPKQQQQPLLQPKQQQQPLLQPKQQQPLQLKQQQPLQQPQQLLKRKLSNIYTPMHISSSTSSQILTLNIKETSKEDYEPTPSSIFLQNATYSELLLETIDCQKTQKTGSNQTELKSSMRLLYAPNKPDKHCNGYESHSLSTISTQNLVDPYNAENKPIERITNKTLTDMSLTDTSSNYFVSKGNLRTCESSQTYGDAWLFSLPQDLKVTKCVEKETKLEVVKPPKPSAIKQYQLQKDKKKNENTSQEIADTAHSHTPKAKTFHGRQWQQPCKQSFVAGNVMPYIGKCPPNFDQISKMNQTRQKFFITQDPQKSYCLRNPEVLDKKTYTQNKEVRILTNRITNAGNICPENTSQTTDSEICEVLDTENPLNLDFQGMDYWNTYQKDEQDFQNQCIYRRVYHYMDRKKIKKNIQEESIKYINATNSALPVYFQVENRNEEKELPPKYDWSNDYSHLYRSADKPYNAERIVEKRQKFKERYEQVIKINEEKKFLAIKEKANAEKEAKEKFVVTLAEENFDIAKTNIENRNNPQFDNANIKSEQIERIYRTIPHTLRETRQLKKQLKKQNRIAKDVAIIKRDFYMENLNKEKFYPEAELEFSEHSSDKNSETTLSEQSTDNEDDIEVGKEHDIVKLRGFHYKMSNNIRGKLHQYETKQKGCISRDEWLKELFPPKEKLTTDVEIGFDKIKDGNHPDMLLFKPKMNYKPIKGKRSAIRDYIKKRLGSQYDTIYRKNLRIVRPRLKYTVQKFNLIRFLHGERAERYNLGNNENLLNRNINIQTTMECIQELEKEQEELEKSNNKARMKLFGFDCKKTNDETEISDLCKRLVGGDDNIDNVDSFANFNNDNETNLDWAPNIEQMKKRRETNFGLNKLSMRMRGNMPAPNYRESTLRCNPNKPRNYELERVPTEIFDETVKFGEKPYMKTLPPDIKLYENLYLKKCPYNEMFEIRRHHDHWNPTQQKLVDVHYQPHIARPQITKTNEEQKKKKHDVHDNVKFSVTAKPPCAKHIDLDLTLPYIDVDDMLAEYFKTHKKQRATLEYRGPEQCNNYDYELCSKYRSFKEMTKNFPGRQEFLSFLAQINGTLEKEKKLYKDEIKDVQLLVDKDKMIEELEEDLKSIQSNLTSLSSSECTNYSNDSGSVLLLGGKFKLPLDYIRKSLIPFDEMQRSNFSAVPIDIEKEMNNQFATLPFAGQRKSLNEMKKNLDKFNTNKTRQNDNLRLRLEVPVDKVNENLLKNFDCRSKINAKKSPERHNKTTDFKNENYISTKTPKPPVKIVNFKSGMTYIKDALRLKFESMVIQNQLVRTKVYDRLNDENFAILNNTSEMYEKLFEKWEKNEYNHTMSIVYQVKSYYETTDILRKEFSTVKRELHLLNMDIVFLESSWIRYIMLQNFHYLLADQTWRAKYDWIHRISPKGRKRHNKQFQLFIAENAAIEDKDSEDKDSDDNSNYDFSQHLNEDTDSIADDEIETVKLESYDISIANRETANIRVREKDDALAVKKYFEEVYEKNVHPILVVFPDAEHFLNGVENLKTKTFVVLLEMHYTITVYSEVQGLLDSFEISCKKELQEKQRYVERKCSKKYFMENRAADLKEQINKFLNKPFEEVIAEPKFTIDHGIIIEAWRAIVPETIRSVNERVPPLTMAKMISDQVMDTIAKYESMPIEKMREIEQYLRFQHKRAVKRSKEAYSIAKRIEMEMNRVRHNLSPPFVKPKRVGKLHRQYLHKRKKTIEIEEQPLTDYTKNFFRAFKPVNAKFTNDVIKESLQFANEAVVQTEDSAPFHFDYFLILNGYKPNYNFTTETELKDGPETNFLHIKKLIPAAISKLKEWEKESEEKMEEDITRDQRMYHL